MFPTPGSPEYKRGEPLSVAEVKRLDQIAREAFDAWLTVNVFDIALYPRTWVRVRVTAQYLSDKRFYSWVEVTDAGDGFTWEPEENGLSGANNLFEINGNTTVPADAATGPVVWAWLSEGRNATAWQFSYQASPAFSGASVFLDGDQAVTFDADFTLTWQANTPLGGFDAGGYFSGAHPTYFTVPEDGHYAVGVNVIWEAVASGGIGVFNANIVAGEANDSVASVQIQASDNADELMHHVSGVALLTAGTRVKVTVSQSSLVSPVHVEMALSGLAGAAVHTRFWIVKLGGGAGAGGSGGSGTVTSVGVTGPNIISWSGTPVTSAGTLTGELAPQAANAVLAAPDGSSGVPTFRALVAGDLPTGTGAGSVTSVSGGATGLTVASPTTTPTLGGTLATAAGGTGLATLTAHAVLLGEGTGSVAFATVGTAGRVLVDQGSGADPAFEAVSGDATLTSAGVLTVGAGAITYAKIQSVSSGVLLGRTSASSGAPQEITVSTGLSLSGTTLTATGGSGTVTSVSQDTGIVCSPNPITGAGSIAVNATAAFIWTHAHTWQLTGQAFVLQGNLNTPGLNATQDSSSSLWRGIGEDGVGFTKNADWQALVNTTSTAGASTWKLQNRIASASFADRLTVTDAGNGTFAGTVAASNLSGSNTGDQTADESTLHLAAGVFSIKSTYTGQTSIVTLGTVTAGTWTATAIALANGGTGQTTARAALDALHTAGADVASASTVDLSASTGGYVAVTGTTTITAFSSQTAGQVRRVKFTGKLTLTHNATSLILPGEANIVTRANDRADLVSLGSGNWLCFNYTRSAVSDVSVYLASTSGTLTQNAWTTIGLDTSVTDTLSEFDTTAHTFTPVYTGLYAVTFVATLGGATGREISSIWNGTSAEVARIMDATATAVGGTVLVDLTAGVGYTFRCFPTTAGCTANGGSSATFLRIRRLP